MTRQAVNYVLAQSSTRAGLAPVNPHMLRHSCGFALANRGYDLRLIQDYLGHRDPKHTVRYTRTAGSGSRGCGGDQLYGQNTQLRGHDPRSKGPCPALNAFSPTSNIPQAQRGRDTISLRDSGFRAFCPVMSKA